MVKGIIAEHCIQHMVFEGQVFNIPYYQVWSFLSHSYDADVQVGSAAIPAKGLKAHFFEPFRGPGVTRAHIQHYILLF